MLYFTDQTYTKFILYLDKGIKYFEDLFLDEDRLIRWIIQELNKTVLQNW